MGPTVASAWLADYLETLHQLTKVPFPNTTTNHFMKAHSKRYVQQSNGSKMAK